MAKVPPNNMRKPTGKKTFSLEDFKKKHNVQDAKDKPLEWLKLAPAIEKETGLPGIPKGYATLARGFSNTGKSTLLSEAIVAAQKNGVLPIIIDTENNIGKERLKMMGFDWDGEYIFIDNKKLLHNFGRNHDKTRSQASIEDMAEAVHFYLDLQDAGELPVDILFAIDSLGTLDCIKSINAHDKGTTDNNLWNAGAFERGFKYILNSRIPSSRKEDSEFTNTIVAVQKIWIDSMGAGVVKHKGGEAFYYGARLIYHFGGVAAHGTKKVKATSLGNKMQYGIQAKIKVEKNQIDGELGGISLDEGSIISAPHGFIEATPEGEKEYKKKHLAYFRKILKNESINASEIGTEKETVFKDDEDQGESLFNDMANDFNVDKDTGEILD